MISLYNYRNIIIIIIIILLIILVYNYTNNNESNNETNKIHEGFTQLVVKKIPKNIYDNFYSEVYDQLFLSDLKNEYECVHIHKNYLKNWKRGKVKLLDVGCGTGHHLKIFKRYGYDVEGLDSSNHMLKKAKIQCPKSTLKKGDFDDVNNYEGKRFTHIICLFFTIYYSNNLNNLFNNFNKWLQMGGYMIIHVVDRKKFDPVLERASSLIPLFDPQRHSDKRTTNTKLAFKEFKYESDWSFHKRKVKFQEVFNFKKEPIRRVHTHKFHIINIRDLIGRANDNGFELEKSIDLFLVGHNYNYLLVFKKKYG